MDPKEKGTQRRRITKRKLKEGDVISKSSGLILPKGISSEDLLGETLLEDRIGVGIYGGTLYVNEIHIHLYESDRPPCLKDSFVEGDSCEICEFLHRDDCLLLLDEFLVDEAYVFAEIYASQAAVARESEELAEDVYRELVKHGRPLHYSVIAELIKGRYPERPVTARRIYLMMAAHSEMFERVETGVYRAI